MAFKKNTNTENNDLDFDFDSEDVSVPDGAVEVSEIIPKNQGKKKKDKKEKTPKQPKEPKQKKEKPVKEKKVKEKPEKPVKPVKEYTEEELKKKHTTKAVAAVFGSFVAIVGLITLGIYSNDYLSNVLMEKLKTVEHENMKDIYSGDVVSTLNISTDKKLNMEDFYNNTQVLYELAGIASSMTVQTEDETGKHAQPNLVLNKVNGVLYEDFEYSGNESELVFEFRDTKDNINSNNVLKLYFNGSGTFVKAESTLRHYLTSKDAETITKLIRKFNGYGDGVYTNSFINKDDNNYYIYKNGESYYGVGVDEVTGIFREFFTVTNYEDLKTNPNYTYLFTGTPYNEVTATNHNRYTYEQYNDSYKISRLSHFDQEDSNNLFDLVNLMLGEQGVDFEMGALYKLDANTTSKQGYKGYNVYIQNKKNMTGDKNFDLASLGINNGDEHPDLYGYIVSSSDNVIIHLKEYRQCDYSPIRSDINTYLLNSKEDITLRSRMALIHKMNNAAINSKIIVLPMMVHDEQFNDEMPATVIAWVNPVDNTIYEKGLIIKPWDIYGQPIDIAGFKNSELGLAMGELVNTKGYINEPGEIVEEVVKQELEFTVENMNIISDGIMLFQAEDKILGVSEELLKEKLGELTAGEVYNIKFDDYTESGSNILVNNIKSAEKIEPTIDGEEAVETEEVTE